MLVQRFPAETLNRTLIPRVDWHPYPTITDRAAWASLPESVRQSHIARGESRLNYAWPSLPATLFLEYVRNGNRTHYQKPSFARRAAVGDLVIAECMEAQGRFLDDIVNGIWMICEESYWGVPAHIRVQKAGPGLPDTAEPTVDLFAAETSALLAWVSYLLGDQLDTVSPLVRPRIAREINRRILTPLLERDDFFWMGFTADRPRVNNWNPWIVSNWLASVLLIEDDEVRRRQSVVKAMHTVDNFIDPYPQDGGCDEGPSYWGRAGASLFDCLELLHSATNGAIDLYAEPLIQEIGRFIYRVQIDGDYYINFADAPAVVTPDAALVYRYGQRIDDAEMMALGASLAAEQKLHQVGLAKQGGDVPVSLGRLLPALFALDEMPTAGEPPLVRDVWLAEIEVMVARDQEGKTDGLYVAAKGGHNQESHNHNDIGNFVIYTDGRPVIVDAGVETYTAKTFSAQRYEIWTMQSAYHSLLPTIDGVQQAPGAEFAARHADYQVAEDAARLILDIGGAYPAAANVTSWTRTITLNRGRNVTIEDEYVLSVPAAEIALSLLTPCAADLAKAGRIVFAPRAIRAGRQAGRGELMYHAATFTAHSETVAITDERLGGIWGDSLTRVILRATQPVPKNRWRFCFTQSPT